METTGGKTHRTKEDILDGGSCTWKDLADSSVEAYGWACILFAENHSEIWAVRVPDLLPDRPVIHPHKACTHTVDKTQP